MKKVDIDNRLCLYKKNNHFPIGEAQKYKFDEIDECFNDLKSNFKIMKTSINICYYKNLPQHSNCVILNCANSDAMNAGYRINHCVTQEGQIFHDSDVFAAKNLSDFYPFNFKEELLYVKNVTFHNNKKMQWDQNKLRKNDVIFAASKIIKDTFEFHKIKPDLKRIIESMIGCGVFKNDKKSVGKIFVEAIKKNIGYFKEIFMVIYDKEGNDKIFNDSFINELYENNIDYKIN